MMEKIKSGVLVLLVTLSLIQSYFLAYNIPSLRTAVTSEQDYVLTEKMGTEERLENLIFPEDMVLHFGENRHTILYPDSNFYQLIFDKLRSREFKGFQRNPVSVQNWSEIREQDKGVELRFGYGVPVELLMKVFKLEGDLLFMGDRIERIWLFKLEEREEVRVYFFSADGLTVYESIRADITISDVQEYVGFGSYWTPYGTTDGRIYLPEQPLETLQAELSFQTYSPEQMQRNLFFDPGITRTIEDRSGTQIYTDGKRGLQVEQDGQWVRYTDPIVSTGNPNRLSDNVYTAIQFINQHGGWDGLHRFVHSSEPGEGRTVQFQQYYRANAPNGALPIIATSAFQFGYIKLVMQQGIVAEYERSLMTLRPVNIDKTIRYLPGGQELMDRYHNYDKRSETIAVFPALRPSLMDAGRIRLTPVWAARHRDGTQAVLMEAVPLGIEVEITPMEIQAEPEIIDDQQEDEQGEGQQPVQGLNL